MSQPFRFRLPTDVRFGEGTAGELPEAVASLGARRVMVVSDPGVRAAGIVDRLVAGLAGEPLIFDGVSPNPRDYECLAGTEAARRGEIDLIVAIGGGSPIDLAKAVAGLATNGGVPVDWEAPARFTSAPLPLIAVPTTAGTGAEVSWSAVISDTTRQLKLTIRDIQLAPAIALVDPELTYSTPRRVTAAVGMDTLTHAVEAYTSRAGNPVSDTLALEAIRLVERHLARVVRNGQDREARRGMMLGSLLAGMAFRNADVAAVHCLAEALGGRYDTPHGVANAVFLPYVFAYNASADPRRHAAVAAALGVDTRDLSTDEAAQEGGAALKALAVAAGIPLLRDLPGVRPEDFPALAAAAARNLSNASNARALGPAEYEEILQLAWDD